VAVTLNGASPKVLSGNAAKLIVCVCFTVSVVVTLSVPYVAVIVVVPYVTAVARPVTASMVATLGSLLDHCS
jgi:hypothetical protein